MLKGKRSVEANVEEDYYNDLLLFMTLLNTLHNTDNLNEDTRFLSNQNSNTSKFKKNSLYLFKIN